MTTLAYNGISAALESCKHCNLNKKEIDEYCFDCAPRDTIPMESGLQLSINPLQVEELALITIGMEEYGLSENFVAAIFNAALYDENILNDLRLFDQTDDNQYKNDIIVKLKRTVYCSFDPLELVKNFDEPMYINPDCDLCGRKLMLADIYYNEAKHTGAISFDEWVCPHCLNGTIYDYPQEESTEH